MWKRIAGGIVLACALAAPVSAQVSWTKASPGGGGAMLTADVAANGTVLVGTDLSGMYRWTGSGDWTRIGRLDGLDATSVEVVRWQPGQSLVALAGTKKGMYRTTNGGMFWSKITDLDIGDRAVTALAWAGSTVYAATSFVAGNSEVVLYKSTDGGQTWDALTNDIPPADPRRCVKLAAGSSANTLWFLSGDDRNVAGAKELWKGTVSGLSSSWTLMSLLGPDSLRAIDFALHPTQDIVVMTTSTTAVGGVDDRGKVYRSVNGGAWTQASITTDATGAVWWDAGTSSFQLINVQADACITPPSTNPPARSGKFQSSDGAVWTKIDDGVGGPAGFSTATWDIGWSDCNHARGRALNTVARTLSANGEYWVTSQFVWHYKTSVPSKFENTFTTQVGSGPATWKTRAIDDAVPVAIAATGAHSYLAGYYDIGIWRTADDGVTWENINPVQMPDWWGVGGNVTGITVSGSVVCATMGAQNKTNRFRLWRSTNGGTTWQVLDTGHGLPDSSFMYGLSRDPDTGRLWVTAGLGQDVSGHVYTSANEGADWTPASGGLPASGIYVTQAKNGVALVGGTNGLWRSTSPYTSWSEVDPGFNYGSNPSDIGIDNNRPLHTIHYHGIHQILFDPTVPSSRVWLVSYYKNGSTTRHKGVWKSDDNGVTFAVVMDSVLRRGVAVDLVGTRLHITSGAATTAGVFDAAELTASVGKQTCTSTTGNFEPASLVCSVDASHPDYRFPLGWAVYSFACGTVFAGVPGYGFMRQDLSCTGGGGGCAEPPCEIETERPSGGGGGGYSAREVTPAADLTLTLGVPHPSPARGRTTVSWSVPWADQDLPFDLSLFDIAGRRVVILEQGAAAAGRFTKEVSFDAGPGGRLRNGIFFIRLRIGPKVVQRTVVLAR